jgi:serine protease Do
MKCKRALSLTLIAHFLGFSFPAWSYDLAPSTTSTVTNPDIDGLQKISQGIAAIAKEARKAVVFVSIEKLVSAPPMGFNPFEHFFGPGFRQAPTQPPPGQPSEKRLAGLGSGFIVDLNLGYVITNNHVIEDADEIHLKLADGRTYGGTVIGRDKRTDIAVVQIKDRNYDKSKLAALILDDSDNVQVGDFAIALGAPFGLESSLSFGVVSAIGREDLQITDLGEFIQTDAAINRGNSGGPLLNAKGKVIGVNTAITSPTGTYAGIGFSVPSNIARNIAHLLINDGKVERGFLGIEMQPLNEELAKEFDLPKDTPGILVTNVTSGSPAEKAGIKQEDIVSEVDGKPITSPAVMSNSIGLKKPGSKVNIKYFRKGKAQTVAINIGTFANEATVASSQSEDPRDKREPSEDAGSAGLSLSALNAKSAEKFGLRSQAGVLIEAVKPQSPADQAELQAGDVIVNIDGAKMEKPADVTRALSTKGKKKFLLRVERGGAYAYRRLVL